MESNEELSAGDGNMIGSLVLYMLIFGVGIAGGVYSGMLTNRASIRLVVGGVGGTFAGSWFDDGPTLALIRGSVAGDLGIIGFLFVLSLFALLGVWIFNLIVTREGPIA